MIVVGTTTAGWKLDGTECSWLADLDAPPGHEVRYFLALEVNQGRDDRSGPLLQRLAQKGGKVWKFSLDDGETVVTTDNRLVHLTTGRNLVSHHAVDAHAEYMLMIDSDMTPPRDLLVRLLELKHPLTAPRIPSYCLGPGAPVPGYDPSWQVHEYQEAGGCWLMHRTIFQRIRWRIDLDRGLTDDYSMGADCAELLGIRMRVRRDTSANHPILVPVEGRDPEARQIRRA